MWIVAFNSRASLATGGPGVRRCVFEIRGQQNILYVDHREHRPQECAAVRPNFSLRGSGSGRGSTKEGSGFRFDCRRRA